MSDDLVRKAVARALTEHRTWRTVNEDGSYSWGYTSAEDLTDYVCAALAELRDTETKP